MQWTGTVTKVNDGTNLLNDKGRNYGKGKAAEVQWHADDDKGEEISFYVVQIKKSVFNCYVEFGKRMFFDGAWNNLALQDALDDEENNDD